MLIVTILVGRVNIKKEVRTLEEIAKSNPSLELGGHFRPKNCLPEQKIAIIVPFRGREDQLKIFLNNMHPFLMCQQLDYKIFVIEQVSNYKY